jgi:hypothetical protein
VEEEVGERVRLRRRRRALLVRDGGAGGKLELESLSGREIMREVERKGEMRERGRWRTIEVADL